MQNQLICGQDELRRLEAEKADQLGRSLPPERKPFPFAPGKVVDLTLSDEDEDMDASSRPNMTKRASSDRPVKRDASPIMLKSGGSGQVIDLTDN
jgi:hypothetical protein